MIDGQREYELVKNIDHYLSLLAKMYAHENKIVKGQIVVNAQSRVQQEWSMDNWNGGTYGHALYLALPEALYLEHARNRVKLQEQIKTDINAIHNCSDEFIEVVFIEAQAQEDGDWRAESGLLVHGQRTITPATEKRIWPGGGFRLFISHKSSAKITATELKDNVAQYGISAFVAHKDIRPTKKWLDEIESALASMHGLVALMTKTFHNSAWTDQELGYAFGRGVPIVAVRLGRDPYGFIGKFQALSTTKEKLPLELVKLFIKHDAMLEGYIGAVAKCKNWDHGNELAEVLPFIENLSKSQIDRLLLAYNKNGEVRGSFGFNGTKPSVYGKGLGYYLTKITGHSFEEDSDDTLVQVS